MEEKLVAAIDFFRTTFVPLLMTVNTLEDKGGVSFVPNSFDIMIILKFVSYKLIIHFTKSSILAIVLHNNLCVL